MRMWASRAAIMAPFIAPNRYSLFLYTFQVCYSYAIWLYCEPGEQTWLELVLLLTTKARSREKIALRAGNRLSHALRVVPTGA